MKSIFHLLNNIRKGDNHSSWKIAYDKFKPAQEGLREALCTLGNGYLGTRGAFPESPASRICYPGTYIAGIYNKTPTHISGKTIYNEDMVNCPNWLFLTFRIGKGDWITPETSRIISFHQELDMRKAVLARKIRIQNRKGLRTTIETQRIVHMGNPHRAAIKYIITPENYSGWIVVRSALDGSVQNTGVVRYRQLNTRQLKPVSAGAINKNSIYLSTKTSHSDIEIAEAAKVRIFTGGKEVRTASRVLSTERKWIAQEFGMYARRRQHYVVDKAVSVYTSRDNGIKDPVKEAVDSVKESKGFEELLKSHKQAWGSLWKLCDIEIDGDAFSQRVLRLHIFHLLQTASAHNANIDAGIPARGLHGEAYRGHIFWDELYALPFYDLHTPGVTRAVLMYRYRRLAMARKYAGENGYRGAMFPWQSGATGEEETQIIHLNPMSGKWGPDFSRIQRHISFAIAYNVWQHWKVAGDLDFMLRYGAEILLSIAQFGSSAAKFNPRDGRYHIEGVMGPDEFHEKLPGASKPGFKDNAYTNLFVVWTLSKAKKMISILPRQHKERIFKKIGLDQKELDRWEDITRRMNIIVDQNGIISQFDGYFGLKELDWEAYRAKYGKIQRMDRILKAEGKSPSDYKAAKQADVLMLFYLFPIPEMKELFRRLGYRFDRTMLRKNYDYYVKRTSHGSTLSKVVHCYLAFLLGKSQEAWSWFLEVLKSDIFDTQGGTTPEGIHVGVMGGSINITAAGFAGVTLLDDRIRINPNLPKGWRGIKLKFLYKDNQIELDINRRSASVFVHGPKGKRLPFPVEIQGRPHYFQCRRSYRVSLKKTKAELFRAEES
ncbi:glycoside hydrolase family 65 protein [Candidatus Omnitrophota bacterium]